MNWDARISWYLDVAKSEQKRQQSWIDICVNKWVFCSKQTNHADNGVEVRPPMPLDYL